MCLQPFGVVGALRRDLHAEGLISIRLGKVDQPGPGAGAPYYVMYYETGTVFFSASRFTACLLAILRLKLFVITKPPKTRYPVAGLPSGAGFTPAGLHDLARPH